MFMIGVLLGWEGDDAKDQIVCLMIKDLMATSYSITSTSNQHYVNYTWNYLVFLAKAYEDLGGNSCAIGGIGLKVKFMLTTTMK
jgi:hypothetical protein